MLNPKLLIRCAFGLALLTVVGCSKNNPVAPTPSTSSIAVNSTGTTLFLGSAETFTAVSTLSNGTTQATTGTWTSDAQAIATVDGTGRVSGVASGDATISVDAGGVRGSKRIRVLPNYQGSWLGNYIIDGCSSIGPSPWTTACSLGFPNGKSFTLAFQFTQANGIVSGTAAQNAVLSNQFSSSVQGNGAVTAQAVGNLGTTSSSQTWNLQSTTDGRIAGTLRFVYTDTSVAVGSATVTATLSNVNRQ
ncbi:MAG: Ig-like domain-containing protein [Vicinamibacterales bacterium]